MCKYTVAWWGWWWCWWRCWPVSPSLSLCVRLSLMVRPGQGWGAAEAGPGRGHRQSISQSEPVSPRGHVSLQLGQLTSQREKRQDRRTGWVTPVVTSTCWASNSLSTTSSSSTRQVKTDNILTKPAECWNEQISYFTFWVSLSQFTVWKLSKFWCENLSPELTNEGGSVLFGSWQDLWQLRLIWPLGSQSTFKCENEMLKQLWEQTRDI